MPVVSHVSDVWFRVTDLEVASGRGCVITTTAGEEYLDFTSGIAVTSTGHCHPKVVSAIVEQAGRFIHAQVNIYRHDLLERLAFGLLPQQPAWPRSAPIRSTPSSSPTPGRRPRRGR